MIKHVDFAGNLVKMADGDEDYYNLDDLPTLVNIFPMVNLEDLDHSKAQQILKHEVDHS